MKRGYFLEDINSWSTEFTKTSRGVMFAKLIREGETVPCAIMMKLYREKTGYEKYFCIPHYNSSLEIWKKAYDDFFEMTSNWDSWQARGYT